MAFIFHSEGSLDYFPCRYGNSRLQLRGPKVETFGPCVATLGGTETYGKFVHQPFPTLVGVGLSLPVVNLGCLHAGPDVYLNDPDLLAIAARATAKIVQIVGAQNISNRYYAVHPRRNDRFLGATPLLRALFPKVDFTEFNFTCHVLVALQRACPDRFEVVAEELRAAWVLRMKALLGHLHDRTVLLWMSDSAPPPPERRVDLSQNPLLIDSEMISTVRGHATAYLEVVYSAAGIAKGCDGMAFGPFEAAAAAELPNTTLHAEVAARVLPTLNALIRNR